MDRWLYRQYRRNLHRPIPPPRARTDVLAWWVAAPLRTLAWLLNTVRK